MVKKRTLEARTKLQHNKFPNLHGCINEEITNDTKSSYISTDSRKSVPQTESCDELAEPYVIF